MTALPYSYYDKYQIERSSLTGKDRKVVFATRVNKLYALALDVIAKRVYFSKDDYIESSDYNGEDRRHISMYTQSPNSIFIDFTSYSYKVNTALLSSRKCRTVMYAQRRQRSHGSDSDQSQFLHPVGN